MNSKKHEQLGLFVDALKNFECNNSKLKGLKSDKHYEVFSKQLIDSVRRIEYVKVIGKRDISIFRTNPHSYFFDPLRAAWRYKLAGDINEACWLIFLSTHCGKHKKFGWQLCRDIYGGLGTTVWTWDKITSDFDAFHNWYKIATLEMARDTTIRAFGNHRKYESLRYNSNRPLHKVIESYIQWVGRNHDHGIRLHNVPYYLDGNPEMLFDELYRSMKSVISFGRTAKFDYLTMLAKFGIVDINPPTLYLKDATGPKQGVNYLFFGSTSSNVSVSKLDIEINNLANYLPISTLPCQVLEDALCNWQKSPDLYIYFGG